MRDTAPRERVILVGAGLKSERALMLSSLVELQGLAETAGAAVVGEFNQSLDRFHPGTLIGEGKIDEISRAAGALKARTVIFDVELAPAQQKNLERLIKAKIVDRTRLILDIFARRAKTSEGRLQVELAQLSYMLPRLTGAWRAFSQQVGGIGTRGPGERKLEYERRHIQLSVKRLQAELERVRDSRALRRRRRLAVPVPQIALIGYTNAGKSTLLNALSRGTKVYADDKLFATLDPTSRRVRLPEGSWIVATDTVGFIQRLPTTLVAAFRSTLEEAALADCLVLVLDASSPAWEKQEAAVDSVLGELGATGLPQIRVFNKADLLEPDIRQALLNRFPDRPMISAEKNQGLEELLQRVQEKIADRWLLRELDVPLEDAPRKRGVIHQSSQVLSETPGSNRMRYRLRATRENWDRLVKKINDPVENLLDLIPISFERAALVAASHCRGIRRATHRPAPRASTSGSSPEPGIANVPDGKRPEQSPELDA